LAPVAWRLIEEAEMQTRLYDLAEFVYEASDFPNDVDARLAKLIANPAWSGAGDILHYLKRKRPDLTPAAWRTVLDSESVWVRAYAYVTFPARCEDDWKAGLFRDLEEQGKPLPAARFARLLSDLDDDRFEAREAASAELGRQGERVESQLQKALDEPLSAEAKLRVKELLEKVKKERLSSACVDVVSRLGYSEAPEAQEVLKVLAAGPSVSRLTIEAKAALERRDKDAPPPDK
jgi:hypothetical protein